MKAVLVFAPSRKNDITPVIPFGLMTVANILRTKGIESIVYDFTFGSMDELLSLVGAEKPSIIGFAGIASSYQAAKRISSALKPVAKDAVYIAGGPLASTYKILLENGVAEYVFHGEAERSLPKFVDFINGTGAPEEIGGISYVKGGKVLRNNPEPQIEDMDSIPFPDYGAVPMERYVNRLNSSMQIAEGFLRANPELAERVNHLVSTGRDRMLDVCTSRGCTHSCLFCYRHMKGIRRFSVDYAVRHIRHLREKFSVNGVSIADELFNSDAGWVNDFCDAVRSEFGEDFFYRVLGARISKMDRGMLEKLKASGCVEINFGHESGASSILKAYRKGVSVEDNIRVTKLANEIGIFTPIQLVIGSPLETTGTILETSDFLRKVGAFRKSTSLNYLIPLPETPIWKYVEEHNLVTDAEEYLGRVSRFGGWYTLGMNLTKAPKPIWIFWTAMIFRRTLINEAKAKKSIPSLIFNYFFGGVVVEFLSPKLKRLFKLRRKSA